MKTEIIPYLGYCFAFMGQRTAFSDYFAKEAAESGKLLCARVGDKFAGYICAAGNGSENRVTYAYTRPEYRGQGIFTALLKEIAEGSEMTVKVNLPADHEFHDTVVHVCKKLGFVQGESLIVYTAHRDAETRWRELMNKSGNRICAMLKRHGYTVVSFAEASADTIEQIRNSDNSEFANPFETRSFFDEPSRKLSHEFSFAAVKDGELAAYTLVSLPSPEKCVVEQIAVSSKKRGSGVILLPFAETAESLIASGVKLVTYAMYESNIAANSFRVRVNDTASQKATENYYLKRQKGKDYGK